MRRALRLLLPVVTLVVGFAPAAFADATLHIGTGAGTPCATGCGGDPNTITPTVLSIYQTSSGAPDLLDPLLLILGSPNTTGLAAAPVIASITEYDPYPGPSVGTATWSLGGTPVYGWDGDGFAGNWTPSDPHVYEFLNLPPPPANASNNATNWFGVAPPGTTFYGIYVYVIHATLGNNGLLDVHWDGSGLPEGTIAIAYGCDRLSSRTNDCPNAGAAYHTPFTEAGRVGRVPEPTMLTLLAAGFGLIPLARRRRRGEAS